MFQLINRLIMTGELGIRRMKKYCFGMLQNDVVFNDMFNFFTDETQEKSLRPETVEIMYNTLLQFTNGNSYFVLYISRYVQG